jgi:pectate lyase
MTTTYNSDGTSSYSKTYDSSRASLLTEIDTLKNNQIHKEKMTEIDYLSNYLIRDTTLLPKESKFGLVKIDYDNSFSNRYVLKVTIGQDTHILKFKKPYRKLN